MVKIPASQVDEELQKQQDEFDEPDESVYGKDVDEDLARVIGNKPGNDPDGFSLAEEEEKDAEAILHGKPEDEIDEEIDELETEIDKLEKEKKKEDTSDE